jgi:UDP-N-acetylmuramyl pentapeptide synthase
VRAAFYKHAEIADPSDILVVLGDMFELGAESARLHAETLEFAAGLLPSAEFALVGGTISAVAERVPALAGRFEAYPDSDALAGRLRSAPPKRSVVFLKGSRGVALERCVPESPAEERGVKKEERL